MTTTAPRTNTTALRGRMLRFVERMTTPLPTNSPAPITPPSAIICM